MPREKKQSEPEQEAGAPEWMVTFSDCMTLLLTFFVLLLSFSSFDNQDNYRKMSSSFANQFSFGPQDLTEKDAISSIRELRPNHELQWGSEKPTLKDGDKDKFKKKTEPADFLKLRTFLVPSGEMFFGNGTAISPNGQKSLSNLSLFLKELPDQMIIVSESGPRAGNGAKDIGFERAWAIFNYLTNETGLDRQQFSFSVVGTAAKEYHSNNGRRGNAASADRVVEIVLLKRSR